MRRPRGQGLLGGAIGITALLLLAACGGSSDVAAPTPEPTVAIAEAPTATAAPAEPTATPEPTAPPTATPEPTAAPELTVEEQVIAAWERYLDLSIQARGKEPTGDAANLGTFITGPARLRLEQVLADQLDERRYLRGALTSGSPLIEFDSDAELSITDCLDVTLESVDLQSDEVLGTQDDQRTSTARMVLVQGGWLVSEVETGDVPGCDV